MAGTGYCRPVCAGVPREVYRAYTPGYSTGHTHQGIVPGIYTRVYQAIPHPEVYQAIPHPEVYHPEVHLHIRHPEVHLHIRHPEVHLRF